MPLREYKCKKCKHRFERIQKFAAQPLRKCPECGGPLEQLLSAPSVRFKGSGFYQTDYVRQSSGGSSESGSSDDSSASKATEKTDAKKTESSGESKPAPKTESQRESKTDSKTESKPKKGK